MAAQSRDTLASGPGKGVLIMSTEIANTTPFGPSNALIATSESLPPLPAIVYQAGQAAVGAAA